MALDVKIVGNCSPWLHLDLEKVNERHQVNRVIYDTWCQFLKERKPKTLESSKFARPSLNNVKPQSRSMYGNNGGKKQTGIVTEIRARGTDSRSGSDFISSDVPGAKAQPLSQRVPNAPGSFNNLFFSRSSVSIKMKSQVDSDQETGPVSRGNPSPINPEAAAFTPAGTTVVRGIRSPEEFMAHVRAMNARGGISIRNAPNRRVLFKKLPEWATLSHVMGLVHGGAVDRVYRSDDTEVTVQFCDETACNKYLDIYANGICIDDHSIEVEAATGSEEVSSALQEKMNEGGSRVVCVAGEFTCEKMQALNVVALTYQVDHVLYRLEKEKVGSAFLFFCSLDDGWSFQKKLTDDEAWNGFDVEFVQDPCKLATGFHDNNVPNRMSTAVASI